MARARRTELEEELSFSAASAALGRKRDPHGRKLRNAVLAREAQTSKWIAIRLQGVSEPKLRITLGALYRAFPELRPDRSSVLARDLRAAMERMKGELREIVRVELDRELPAEVRRAVATELAKKA